MLAGITFMFSTTFHFLLDVLRVNLAIKKTFYFKSYSWKAIFTSKGNANFRHSEKSLVCIISRIIVTFIFSREIVPNFRKEKLKHISPITMHDVYVTYNFSETFVIGRNWLAL